MDSFVLTSFNFFYLDSIFSSNLIIDHSHCSIGIYCVNILQFMSHFQHLMEIWTVSRVRLLPIVLPCTF